MPEITDRVLDEIGYERTAQDAKWGEQNHPDGTGPRVAFAGRLCYMEDAARDFRLACKARSGAIPGLEHHGPVTWKDILLEEVFEGLAEDNAAELRAELVQVAAVAVQWIEAIDRRPGSTSPEPGPHTVVEIDGNDVTDLVRQIEITAGRRVAEPGPTTKDGE
jgi:hypothetical protein